MPSSAAAAGHASASCLTRRRDQPSSPPSTSATGRTAAGVAQLRRRQEPQPGAAQQHVGDASAPARGAPRSTTSASRSGRPGTIGAASFGSSRASVEDRAGGVPVAEGELGERLLADPVGRLQVLGARLHPERDLGRVAGRLAALALDQAVDGLLRHPPPGGQLAAGDRQHPGGGLVQLRLARDVDRLARVAGRDQRPHAGVGADQVRRAELGAEEVVDRVEQVLDVLDRRAAGGRCRPRSRCRWCRPGCARTRAGRRSCRPSPAGTMQAAVPVGRSARSSSRWVPRLGAIRGTSSSSTTSSGRIAVGPDAGRVDDVGRRRPRSARPTRPRRRRRRRRGRSRRGPRSPRRRSASPRRSARPRRGRSARGARRRSGSRRRGRRRWGRAARAPGPARAPRRGRSCGGGPATSRSPRPPPWRSASRGGRGRPGSSPSRRTC